MRTDDFRPSDNVEDDREQSASRGGLPGGAGGLGIGTIIVIGLISWYFGIDPSALLNGAQILSGGSQSQSTNAAPPVTAGTPQDPTGKFVAMVLGDTEARCPASRTCVQTASPPALRACALGHSVGAHRRSSSPCTALAAPRSARSSAATLRPPPRSTPPRRTNLALAWWRHRPCALDSPAVHVLPTTGESSRPIALTRRSAPWLRVAADTVSAAVASASTPPLSTTAAASRHACAGRHRSPDARRPALGQSPHSGPSPALAPPLETLPVRPVRHPATVAVLQGLGSSCPIPRPDPLALPIT